MIRVQEAVILHDDAAIEEMKRNNDTSEVDQETLDLAHLICKGDYISVLQSPFAAQLLPHFLNLSTKIDEHLESLKAPEYDAAAFKYTLIGAACLDAYVQLNWTGPSLPIPDQMFPNDLTRENLNDLLFVDGGETVYQIIREPALLIAARSILTHPYSSSPALYSTQWWAIRCLRVQQTTLTDRAPSIKMSIIRYLATLEEYFNSNQCTISNRLKGCFYIEKGLFYYSYRETSTAITAFSFARHATGLNLEISGALGKRTKFQQKDTSQLIVRASSADPDASDVQEIKTAPKQVDQEHELLLKSTLFSEEQHHGSSLSLIDQSLMLALLCAIKVTNPLKDPLAVEERLAFLHRVGLESKNWMVHSAFLLYKAQIESESLKTFDRALLQIQSLADQYDDEEPHPQERMKCIYTLNYPPRHLLRRELGQRYLKFGIAASARDIFKDLFMWEDLIRSYIILGDNDKATVLTKERLEIQPTPELYCLLGELEKNEDHFRTAWEFSKHRFAQAHRLLGKAHLRRKEYEQAVTSFRLSLGLNPLYPNIWFSMGCCYLQLENWEEGARAFTSCVQQEPEDGNAWSNLSTALQQLGKPFEAFSAIKEAIKQNQESWKLWENAFLLSLEVGDFSYAVQAINRLLDLKRSDVKFQWIKLLATYVTKSLQKGDDSRVVKFQTAQIEKLLDRTAELMVSTPEVWETYAVLHMACDNVDQALDCRQKQVRLLSKINAADMTATEFETLVKSEVVVGDLHKKVAGKKPIHAFVLHLRSLLRKVEEYYGTTESYQMLKDLYDEMIVLENQLK